MHFERPTAHKLEFPAGKRIIFLIFVAVIGLITGAIGFALAARWLTTPIATRFLYDQNPGLYLQQDGQDSTLRDLPQVLEPRLALLRRHKTPTEGDDTLIATDPALYAGTAAVITSDGWMVTSDSLIKGIRYDAILDGSTFAIERAVTDAYTGLIFLKVAVQDAKPIDMYDEEPRYGDSVVNAITDTSGSLVLSTTRVTDPLTHPVLSAVDLVRSTTRLSEFTRVQDEGPQNGIYTTLSAQLLGLRVPDGASGLVPAREIQLSFEQILRDQRDRDFGISFVDIRLPGNRQAVRVYHPSRNPVVANSIAQKAGIQSGDIILALNGVNIDTFTTFPSLWRKYQHQDKIRVQLIRNGRDVHLESSLQ